MDPEEYRNLKSVESNHWYYKAKRAFSSKLLKEYAPQNTNRRLKLLDIGPGTGVFGHSLVDTFDVSVIEPSEHALPMLKVLFPANMIHSGTLESAPWDDGFFDAITGLDVLEHIEDDRGALRAIHRLLKPNGTLLLTVPASMALWSEWDTALHHFRRYSKGSLLQLFPEAEWTIQLIKYTNSLVYPLVYAARKLRFSGMEQSEHKIPPPWLNTLLYQQFYQSSLLPNPLPFGVSLLMIAQVRKN